MSTVRDEIKDVLCDVGAESFAAAHGATMDVGLYDTAVDRLAAVFRDAMLTGMDDLYERNVIDARLHEVGLVEGGV